MRYLSVCSGIEAASAAWMPLGFSPVGFSEIDEFANSLLSYRFPEVRNYGDMNGYKDWGIKSDGFDILVGGTPCQSFSIAGLRQGLDDPRGQLMLVWCAMVAHYRPKWIVWENVPGVLTSDSGRDFASLVWALAELGYGFSWRVLDAKFFGLAQRRKRVFLVGCSDGDPERASKVLLERECMLGNDWARRKTRETASGTTPYRIDGSDRKRSVSYGIDENETVTEDVYGTLVARKDCGGFHGNVAQYAKAVSWQSDSPRGSYPKDKAQLTHSQVEGTLQGHEGRLHLRRLMPVECEILQGFPPGWTYVPYKGRWASDRQRYQAVGNSIAVPVLRWIGERIKQVEEYGSVCQVDFDNQ